MTTSTKSVRRPTITLALPGSVSALVSYAKGIVTRMTTNPHVPNPTPTLAAVTAAINDLQIAETAALSRIKGAVVARNEKRTALVSRRLSLRSLSSSTSTCPSCFAACVASSSAPVYLSDPGVPGVLAVLSHRT